MNDNTTPITTSELHVAYSMATDQLPGSGAAVPPGAQDAARAAIAALEVLSRAVERINLQQRITRIEKQAKDDRKRLAELDDGQEYFSDGDIRVDHTAKHRNAEFIAAAPRLVADLTAALERIERLADEYANTPHTEPPESRWVAESIRDALEGK